MTSYNIELLKKTLYIALLKTFYIASKSTKTE